MMKFIGLMVVCTLLSLFMGPLPFIVVVVVYLAKWILKR